MKSLFKQLPKHTPRRLGLALVPPAAGVAATKLSESGRVLLGDANWKGYCAGGMLCFDVDHSYAGTSDKKGGSAPWSFPIASVSVDGETVHYDPEMFPNGHHGKSKAKSKVPTHKRKALHAETVEHHTPHMLATVNSAQPNLVVTRDVASAVFEDIFDDIGTGSAGSPIAACHLDREDTHAHAGCSWECEGELTVHAMPWIDFHVAGADEDFRSSLSVSPEEFIQVVRDDSSETLHRCVSKLRIATPTKSKPAESKGPKAHFQFGAPFLHRYYTMLDFDNGQVGFALQDREKMRSDRGILQGDFDFLRKVAPSRLFLASRTAKNGADAPATGTFPAGTEVRTCKAFAPTERVEIRHVGVDSETVSKAPRTQKVPQVAAHAIRTDDDPHAEIVGETDEDVAAAKADSTPVSFVDSTDSEIDLVRLAREEQDQHRRDKALEAESKRDQGAMDPDARLLQEMGYVPTEGFAEYQTNLRRAVEDGTLAGLMGAAEAVLGKVLGRPPVAQAAPNKMSFLGKDPALARTSL